MLVFGEMMEKALKSSPLSSPPRKGEHSSREESSFVSLELGEYLVVLLVAALATFIP